MGRVGIFNPYAHALGGGEKYLYSILEELVAVPGTDVTLFTPEQPDPHLWRQVNVHVDVADFTWRRAGIAGVTPRTAGLDLFVAVTNHLPPLSLARWSAVIVQFPFTALRDPGGLPSALVPLKVAERRLRLRSYDKVLCYSDFVASAVIERLGVREPVVLNPPVDTDGAAAGEPGTSIIAVGRFFPSPDGNNKKHEVLIEAFRRLSAQPEAAGWRLELVGGCAPDQGSQDHLAVLRRQAEGLDVGFHPNADASELAALYDRANVFWHAAGHGEVRPERFEHFGITTVEAMAHGCVPVVPALGGQLEIVQDGVNGRLWRTVDELVSVTGGLIARPDLVTTLREQALTDSERFSRARFSERVRVELVGPVRL